MQWASETKNVIGHDHVFVAEAFLKPSVSDGKSAAAHGIAAELPQSTAGIAVNVP